MKNSEEKEYGVTMEVVVMYSTTIPAKSLRAAKMKAKRLYNDGVLHNMVEAYVWDEVKGVEVFTPKEFSKSATEAIGEAINIDA